MRLSLVLVLAVVVSMSSLSLYLLDYRGPSAEVPSWCEGGMPLHRVKRMYPDWNVLVASRLPPGYRLQCVIPYAPVMIFVVYWNRGPNDPPTPHEHQYIEGWRWDGAIVVKIERIRLENEREAILTEYENRVKSRPDRQLFLIDINGVLAIGKEPCADCGIMIDYMPNGTVYTGRFPTLGRLDFYRNGFRYTITSNMSLSILVEVARSMTTYW